MIKFSCLMSCYAKDDPKALEECFRSLMSQTRKASEIVLVKDGPLPNDLNYIIDVYKKRLPIREVPIEKNEGLGYALNVGVCACNYEIIARIDADDICAPDRFECQINCFEMDPGFDVIGSWIGEFEENPNEIYAYRKLPINHDDILKYAKKRNPVNHMTVAFKKNSVIEAGNYDVDFKFAQDYLLWARMLMKGFKFKNIPKYLVNARAGVKMLERRGGIEYFLYEIELQKKFKEMGLINGMELFSNLVLRGFVRLIPNKFRGFIYKNVLRK